MMRLAHRALDIDPRSIFAARMAAHAHFQNVIFGFAIDPQFDRSEEFG